MPSKIEWTDETWNPITGCTKVSAGCKNCYAERIAKRFWGDRKFTDVLCHPERLEIPLHWKKPRRIFVCSMSDLFHPGASPDFVVSVFEIMTACPQHDFQVLTKRTERIAPVLFGEDGNWYLGGGDYLPNVWMGVTCEDQDTANKRIPVLFDSWLGIKFVSCEPLLENIDFVKTAYGIKEYCGREMAGLTYSGFIRLLDWVIVGAETGPDARYMDPDWAREIRDACQKSGIPFFMKQMSNKAPIPNDLMIREYV